IDAGTRLQRVRATAKFQRRTLAHVECTATRTAVAKLQGARLHLHRPIIIKWHAHGTQARSCRLAEGPCIAKEIRAPVTVDAAVRPHVKHSTRLVVECPSLQEKHR